MSPTQVPGTFLSWQHLFPWQGTFYIDFVMVVLSPDGHSLRPTSAHQPNANNVTFFVSELNDALTAMRILVVD